MKNKRGLLIAIALGIIALVVHQMYIKKKLDDTLGPYEQVSVVVATKDILFNQRIEANMVATENIPKKFLQPQAIW